MDYYVYGHIFKDTGELFYIGKGKNKRAWSKKRSQKWLQITQNRDIEVVLILKSLTESEAFSIEKILISFYSPVGNTLPGGKQSPINTSEYLKFFYSTEAGHKKKLALKNRMSTDNPMKTRKMRELQRSRNLGNNNFFHKLSAESREKHRKNVSKSKMGFLNPNSKPIKYLPTGKVYGSIAQCRRENKLNKTTAFYVANKIFEYYE